MAPNIPNYRVLLNLRGMKCGGGFHPWAIPSLGTSDPLNGARVHFRLDTGIDITIHHGWGGTHEEAARLQRRGRAFHVNDGDYEVMLEVDPATGRFKPVTLGDVGRMTFHPRGKTSKILAETAMMP